MMALHCEVFFVDEILADCSQNCISTKNKFSSKISSYTVLCEYKCGFAHTYVCICVYVFEYTMTRCWAVLLYKLISSAIGVTLSYWFLAMLVKWHRSNSLLRLQVFESDNEHSCSTKELQWYNVSTTKVFIMQVQCLSSTHLIDYRDSLIWLTQKC